MCRIYLSIPVVICDRDNVIDTMFNGIAKLPKFSKSPFIFDHWKQGWVYDNQSVAKADIFIFTHPDNAFKFNIATLPSGVYREYNQAKTLGKKIYLAYRTSDGCTRYYDFTETNSLISGLPGTTHSLASFLKKPIPQVQVSKGYDTIATHESYNPCAETPLPEPFIDLCKKVQSIPYDKRLLL